jgi:hypothetical protein
VFKTLKIAGHIAVDERNPDTHFDRESAVLPGDHVGGGSDVEQAPTASQPIVGWETWRMSFQMGRKWTRRLVFTIPTPAKVTLTVLSFTNSASHAPVRPRAGYESDVRPNPPPHQWPNHPRIRLSR